MKGRSSASAHAQRQAWAVLVLLLVATGSRPVSAGSVAAYWGQNGNEGSLADACASSNYEIIMVSFLYAFGGGRTPALDLAGHCDPTSNGCQGLVSDIESCQSQGLKVLLSLGGGSGAYGFSSAQDAEDLAQYLWENFLGGSSVSSPFGAVQLDGVDLDIEGGGSRYYPDLISSLRQIADNNGYKQLYISAAPQCPFPDAMLGPDEGKALSTGSVDFVFIQFYNNYCAYGGGLDQMVGVWQEWTSALPSAKVYLGLPASSDAAGSGYVDPNTLTNQILPAISTSSNYAGVMLWSVYYDEENNEYSSQIKNDV